MDFPWMLPRTLRAGTQQNLCPALLFIILNLIIIYLGSTDVSGSNVPHTAQAYLAPGEEGGAAANETSTMEGAEFCPRCGKQVFIAEKKQAGGKVR